MEKFLCKQWLHNNLEEISFFSILAYWYVILEKYLIGAPTRNETFRCRIRITTYFWKNINILAKFWKIIIIFCRFFGKKFVYIPILTNPIFFDVLIFDFNWIIQISLIKYSTLSAVVFWRYLGWIYIFFMITSLALFEFGDIFGDPAKIL